MTNETKREDGPRAGRGLSDAPSGHQEKQAMHTPGPWSAHHTRISWWIEAPGDRSRFISGPIPAHVWHLEPRERENCEALRNARLIAAAPDMLSVLEAIDDMWSDDGEGGRVDPIHARSARVREIWQQMRAALAKARTHV